MAKKLLIGLSLAVVVMLAVPLGLMAASVIRGESPKQIAEKEQLGEVDPGGEDGAQADALKPVVQPDPGPMPPPPVLAAAEPAEDASEPEAAPAPDTGKKQAKKAAPKAEPKARPQTPKDTLPKAVLGPNEAPCMVDGLDGYSYDY